MRLGKASASWWVFGQGAGGAEKHPALSEGGHPVGECRKLIPQGLARRVLGVDRTKARWLRKVGGTGKARPELPIGALETGGACRRWVPPQGLRACTEYSGGLVSKRGRLPSTLHLKGGWEGWVQCRVLVLTFKALTGFGPGSPLPVPDCQGWALSI